MFLLLTLNNFHILFWYFHCWIEQVNTSCVNNRNSSYRLSRGSINLPNVRTRKQNDTAVQKHGIRYWGRSSPPEVLLGKGVLKICRKFTGQHPCWSVISIESNFIEITLWHGCSPVNLLYIFRTLFPKNITIGPLLLRELLQNQEFIFVITNKN